MLPVERVELLIISRYCAPPIPPGPFALPAAVAKIPELLASLPEWARVPVSFPRVPRPSHTLRVHPTIIPRRHIFSWCLPDPQRRNFRVDSTKPEKSCWFNGNSSSRRDCRLARRHARNPCLPRSADKNRLSVQMPQQKKVLSSGHYMRSQPMGGHVILVPLVIGVADQRKRQMYLLELGLTAGLSGETHPIAVVFAW